jgi:hypothetical protein
MDRIDYFESGFTFEINVRISRLFPEKVVTNLSASLTLTNSSTMLLELSASMGLTILSLCRALIYSSKDSPLVLFLLVDC